MRIRRCGTGAELLRLYDPAFWNQIKVQRVEVIQGPRLELLSAFRNVTSAILRRQIV